MKDRLFVCDYCGELFPWPALQLKHACRLLMPEVTIGTKEDALKPPEIPIITLESTTKPIPENL